MSGDMYGTTSGGNMRSFLSDFEITNTAELEAHINMNATAARANFEKHYADRLADPNRAVQVHKRRLDTSGMALNRDKNLLTVDLSSPKFDYTTLESLYLGRLKENGVVAAVAGAVSPLPAGSQEDVFALMVASEQAEEKAAKLAGGINLEEDEEESQLTIDFLKCDYVNVDKVVKAVGMSSIFTRISFANSGFSDDECDDFATLVRTCKSLRSLDLSGNKIGGEGIGKIVDAIIDVGSTCSISELNLGGNELSKTAATHLARLLLSPGCTIRVLLLAGNKLGIYGAEELAKGLAGNTSLSSISLQNNNIGCDGYEKLVTVTFPVPEAVGGGGGGGDLSGIVSYLMGMAVDGNRIDEVSENIPQLKKVVDACTKYNERRWALREWVTLESATRWEVRGLRLDELCVLHSIEGQCRAAVVASANARRLEEEERKASSVAKDSVEVPVATVSTLEPVSQSTTDTKHPPPSPFPPAKSPSKTKATTAATPPATTTGTKRAKSSVVARVQSPGPKKAVVAPSRLPPTSSPTAKVKTATPKAPNVNPLPPKSKGPAAASVKASVGRGVSPAKPAPKRGASKSPMKKKK